MTPASALPDLDIQDLKRGICFVRLPEPGAARKTILGMRDHSD